MSKNNSKCFARPKDLKIKLAMNNSPDQQLSETVNPDGPRETRTIKTQLRTIRGRTDNETQLTQVKGSKRNKRKTRLPMKTGNARHDNLSNILQVKLIQL